MLYQPRPVLQTGEDIGVKHIIADIVHGALACALSVLATMIMAVRLAVLPVLPIGQRPAAIRTFYQSGKNLRCTILALPAAVCYLLLYLPENLFADNRLLRILHPHPFTLGLAYPPLVLKGNVRFPVVDGMADIGFIFHNALDLGYRPCVAFFLRRTRIDVCKSPITLEIDKSRCGNLFHNQYSCDTGRPSAMNGKVKNLLHYPAGFLVDYQLVFDFRVFPVPDGSIGTDTLSCGKLRFESGLYLAARIFRKPFIEQVFERDKIGKPFLCVLILRNGDVAHPFFREQKFQIVVHHHMFPPETGKVFRDNAVYFSGFHIVHHALKIRAFKVRPRPAIVHILTDYMKSLFLCVLLQDCPLCFNAYAVTIVFIVPAQSHIKRRVVNRSIVRLFHR